MALRDIRLQLEIDTGAGTMCPCTDDYVIDIGAVGLYFACGINFDTLDMKPVIQLQTAIENALDKIHPRDPQVPRLKQLLDDCLTHPNAVLAVLS